MTDTSQIRFLADTSGKWTEALDLTFDSAAVFGNNRSKRYALVIEDGKVKEAHVEPDNTGVNGKLATTPTKTASAINRAQYLRRRKCLVE